MRKPPPPPSTPDAASDLIGGLVRLAEHYRINPVVAFAAVAGVTLAVAKMSAGKHVDHAAHHGRVGGRPKTR